MIKIIIDTREQTPWHFPPELASVSRGTLRTGDYALAGDPLYAIERKSLDDFVGTISSGWERFEREITRMDALAARTVIVEASINDIHEHNYNHPRVPPGFVLKRIGELSLRNVSVLLCDNPIMAAGMCYIILKLRFENGENKSQSRKSTVSETGQQVVDSGDGSRDVQRGGLT